MGFWGSGKGTENGWWSFDDTDDHGRYVQDELDRERDAKEAKEARKAEKRRASYDDDDDDDSGLSEEGTEFAAVAFAWLLGIGLVINFWYITIPIAILWLIGTLTNDDDE